MNHEREMREVVPHRFDSSLGFDPQAVALLNRALQFGIG
jgi:hypothetical protein